MSTIEQTLNAGVPVTFPGGEQFHLLEADEPVDVTFYDNRNRPIEKWEDMKGGFRHTIEDGFIQVRLESATGQTVKIALTSGRGEYDRSQGDVDILNIVKDNSWYYDSLQKKAFIGGGEISGTSMFYASVQLWNPAASGKNLICEKVHISEDIAAAQIVTIRHHNAAITTAASQGNKYLNEAAGVGLVKKHATDTLLGTEIAQLKLKPGNGLCPGVLKSPIIIGPGLGLLLQYLTLVDGQILSVMFEWTEIPA